MTKRAKAVLQHLASASQCSGAWSVNSWLHQEHTLTLISTAVSLDMDVNTDKELIAHGYSNLLSGLVGTVYVVGVISFCGYL